MKGSRGLDVAMVLAAMAVLTVAGSWPLILHMQIEVPVSGHPADAMHMLFGLGWGTHALGHAPFDYFHAPFFYPYAHSLAFLDQMFGLVLLSAPVVWTTGNIVLGYNAVWLATFLLSGLGVYLLARYLTGTRRAALLAAVIYSFHPFRYHNVGQINVLAMMWIPFALLSLHVWIREGRRGALVGFASLAVLQFLTNAYSGVFLFLSVLLYVAVLLVLRRGPTLDLLRRHRGTIVMSGITGGLVALLFYLPFLRNLGGEVGFERSLGQAALFSAVPADFVTPAPGSLLARLLPVEIPARHALFPGVVAVLLTGWWLLARGWHGARREEMIFYVLLGAAASILAMGPVLGSRIPLPFALAYYVFPGAAFIRAPVRFVVLASLAVAVLAAAGAARMTRPGGRVPPWALSVLTLFCVGELLAPPIGLLRPLPEETPSVYRWLETLEDPVVLVELPMPRDSAAELAEQAQYQLYALEHGHRLVNGLAAYAPPLTRRVRLAVQDFPSDESIALLRGIGATHVLVHTDRYSPESLRTMRERLALRTDLTGADYESNVWVLPLTPSS